MSKKTCVQAYAKAFRDQVVKLVQAGNRSLNEVAEEIGISADSVRRWVKQAALDQACAKALTATTESD